LGGGGSFIKGPYCERPGLQGWLNKNGFGEPPSRQISISPYIYLISLAIICKLDANMLHVSKGALTVQYVLTSTGEKSFQIQCPWTRLLSGQRGRQDQEVDSRRGLVGQQTKRRRNLSVKALLILAENICCRCRKK
jgi:hypothetical protein